MPNKNPYMPFWVDDYIRGVRRLSLEARGLYVSIILELWVVGELPDDLDYIADEIGINKRLFKRVFKEISDKFLIKDGVLSHSRVTKERLKLESKSEKARESAKKRWGDDANALDSQCYTESDTESDTNNKKNKTKKAAKKQTKKEAFVEEIVEFYRENIHRDSIAQGRKNLVSLNKTKKIPLEDLFEYAKNYAEYVRINATDAQYRTRMNNFYGRKGVYMDHTQKPQNGPVLNPENPYDTKGKDYGDETRIIEF